ncbi:MAG TPA: acyltransferase, partial [Gemmatimonadaceae bacterium]|nr:acyltransferase [Gemmatimonadaceae bacterium]
MLNAIIEGIIGRIKGDRGYRIAGDYTQRQLVTVLWHRGWQVIRGLPLRARPDVRGVVLRGRRVVVEHARQLAAGPGLVLEDGAHVNALSRDGIILGRNVTIARGASLVCTGVLSRIGIGIRLGDRSAIGAGSFLGGQGGIVIGDDVIMGPGVRIFSENHRYDSLHEPIRAQGEARAAVRIEDDCWIGSGATILAGVTIGTGCVVAAGAVVTRHVPAWSVAAGVPARVVRSRRPAEEARPDDDRRRRHRGRGRAVGGDRAMRAEETDEQPCVAEREPTCRQKWNEHT